MPAARPVAGAELAVVVVDEAVLALTGYQLADPLALFYPDRGAGVSDYRLRQYVLLVDPARCWSRPQAWRGARAVLWSGAAHAADDGGRDAMRQPPPWTRAAARGGRRAHPRAHRF